MRALFVACALGVLAEGRERGGCPGVSDNATFESFAQRGAELARDTATLGDAEACLQRSLDVAASDAARLHARLNLAVVVRLQGDAARAEKVLDKAPAAAARASPQAARLMGVLRMEQGNAKGALESLAVARSLTPSDVAIYRDIAQAYYSLGSPSDAAEAWKGGVAAIPAGAEGFLNVAILSREMGKERWEEAERAYLAAVRLDADSARVRYSFGNLLFDAGRLEEAARVYREALRRDPAHEDAANNLGNALRQAGKVSAARRVFEAALQTHPASSALLLNAGQVYQDLDLFELAETVALLARKVDPQRMEAELLLGSVAYARNELAVAIKHYRAASSLAPTAAQPLLNLANTLGDLYRQMEARTSNQDPENRARMAKVNAESVAVYEQMLVLNSQDGDALLNLLWAKKYACDWSGFEEGMVDLDRVVTAQLLEGKVPSLKPFLALAFPVSPALYKGIAEAHARDEARKAGLLLVSPSPLPHPSRLLPDNRLRLAYLSTDLGDHPVGHQAWFWAHDTAQFDLHLLALSSNDGSVWWQRTAAMVPEGNFHELGKIGLQTSTATVAQQVNSLGVHILITLNGWTAGNQVDLLALRPAPLQVEYMGSHDTLGASFVDSFVSDRIATPPEMGEFFTESLLLVPNSFFINEYRESRKHVAPLADALHLGDYSAFARADEARGAGGRPAGDWPPTREGVGLPGDAFVLCNFNQLFKVDPAVFRAWMQVLVENPKAVLWLLRLPSTAEANLRREAGAWGLEKRLVFSDRLDWNTHLVYKAMANLSVDTPVFNSHTSGVDMLFAGVPLLTLPCETMSARVAASLLLASSDAALVARDLPDYTAIASRLASRKGAASLRRVRARIQQGRGAAALYDTAATVRALERALRMHFQAAARHKLQKREGCAPHVVVTDRGLL